MSKSVNMKIALICVLCFVLSLAGGFTSVGAVEADTEYTEIPLYVDGIRAGNGLKIASTTYIPLRAFCEALGMPTEIIWTSETKTASVRLDGLSVDVSAGSKYMIANNRYLFLADGAKNVNGVMMVPVRELAKAFGIGVQWDEEYWAMNMDTAGISFIADGDSFYDSEDLYWLSRIISAESGNQPLEGMIGVGNVVLNRVVDPTCPDTVYDVIFDRTHGVQFSPVSAGTIYNEPREEAVIAAKLCLDGYETVGASLFFLNPAIGVSGWFIQTRTYVTTIGDHDFYA